MNRFQLLFVASTILVGTVGQASISEKSNFSCADLHKASQKISAFLENIANVNTTRTEAGGPYKRIEVKCFDLYCENSRVDEFRTVSQPGHPDSNSEGLVKYPNINVADEYQALNNAAIEIRLLASKQVCGSNALMSSTSAMIKYESGSSIQSDTFAFGSDGKVTSWARTLRDGTIARYAFGTDGNIVR